jgi:YD repeat-containing protein
VSQYVSQSVLNNPSSDAALLAQLNPLKSAFPDAQVSTYTYKPLVGMTSATDPKGQITYYEYDNYNRLANIKDQDGKILKHTDYHYQGQ